MQAFRVAQCKLERDSTTIGMADEMEGGTIGANVLNGSRLLRKAQRTGAMPAVLVAMTPKIDRHGLEADELLRERSPLPRGAC
jgi:hypothetical protein